MTSSSRAPHHKKQRRRLPIASLAKSRPSVRRGPMTLAHSTASGEARSAHATRTLPDIHAEILRHFEENPTHGYNCICMDRLIGEVRQQLLHVGVPIENVPTPASKARHALRYIILTVTRQL